MCLFSETSSVILIYWFIIVFVSVMRTVLYDHVAVFLLEIIYHELNNIYTWIVDRMGVTKLNLKKSLLSSSNLYSTVWFVRSVHLPNSRVSLIFRSIHLTHYTGPLST